MQSTVELSYAKLNIDGWAHNQFIMEIRIKQTSGDDSSRNNNQSLEMMETIENNVR